MVDGRILGKMRPSILIMYAKSMEANKLLFFITFVKIDFVFIMVAVHSVFFKAYCLTLVLALTYLEFLHLEIM